jgi:restriction system protein
MIATDLPNVHIPDYPDYAAVRAFLTLMEGQSRRTLTAMRETIQHFIGTVQDVRDWSEPDLWISSILGGDERTLAFHLWEGSDGLVNPRHLAGIWSLASSYGLLVEDDQERLHTTPLGQNFLENPDGEAVQYLDYSEGLLHLLAIVAEHGPGKRENLLPPFIDFMGSYSRVKSPAAVAARWQDRIANLVERRLVARDDATWQIAPAGMIYLERVAGRLANTGDTITARTATDLRKLLVEQHAEVRRNIAEALRIIDPYRLEQLVKTLLGAMGYEKVEVTRRSGDGGVDVVGDIRVGITYVREVVQVKRQQANIQRPILDQLRGSLHRFKALRGTIITTGRFSRGAQDAAFEVGAAPITLIDGERLIDLLIKHEIGARKQQIEVLNFSPSDFEFSE